MQNHLVLAVFHATETEPHLKTDERRIHQFFLFSVFLKGANAILECVSGIVLSLASKGPVAGVVSTLTQQELIEDPSDFLATHLLHFAQHLSISEKDFYALYLLAHGVIKIFLVVGLLRNRLWAYPAALIILSLFVVYQLFRLSYTHSLGLVFLTVLDIVLIALIWHEYALMRKFHRGT